MLDTFTDTYPGYDKLSDSDQKLMKAGSLEAWMTTVFLRGGNQLAYRELLKDYWKDYANWEDNYPKSVRQVIDVTRQSKPQKKKESYSKNRNQNSNSQNNKNQNQNRNSTQDSNKRESSFVQGTSTKKKSTC